MKQKQEVEQWKDGVLVKTWKYAKDVYWHTGFNSAYIIRCCDNHIKSAYGFNWKYKKEGK